MRKVLLATSNPSKQEKLKWVLEGLGFKYINFDDIEPKIRGKIKFKENGKSFKENAVIKAVNWSQEVDCLTIASDGGVHIPALGDNWNGLMTHRFAGQKATDQDRVKALLTMMKPYQGKQRIIYWSEAVALAQKGKKIVSWQVDGDQGVLAQTYDPEGVKPGWWMASLWYYPEYNKTYNDLTEPELAKVNTVWSQLKKKIQKFFRGAKIN